jgi:hypothetical protein
VAVTIARRYLRFVQKVRGATGQQVFRRLNQSEQSAVGNLRWVLAVNSGWRDGSYGHESKVGTTGCRRIGGRLELFGRWGRWARGTDRAICS